MILHADAHWVTVAAVNDDIVYMDSMRPHRPITPYVITQLMQLFASKVDEDGKLKVKIIPSTPQHNADDCGVFVAAYVILTICRLGLIDLRSLCRKKIPSPNSRLTKPSARCVSDRTCHITLEITLMYDAIKLRMKSIKTNNLQH